MAILMFFALSLTTTIASANSKKASDNNGATNNKENRLTDEEISRMTKRVEEISNMDKSNLTATEKSELRKELKATKASFRKDGGVIYVSAGTLILIIILIIILV